LQGGISSVLLNETTEFSEESGDLETIDPVGEEPRVLAAEFGEGTVGVAQVGHHYLLHNQGVDFVAWSLEDVAVVETETDVQVVQTDFFIQIEVEYVEVDAENGPNFVHQKEEIFFTDNVFGDTVGGIETVVVLQYVGHCENRQSFLMPVLIEIALNFL
jgi:hypothetical protein